MIWDGLDLVARASLEGADVHEHLGRRLANQPEMSTMPTISVGSSAPVVGAAFLRTQLPMQGPQGDSQARQAAAWRRPAPSSLAARACIGSVEQGCRHGRDPGVGGRLLLGQIPWACALCQGALAETLQGAGRRIDTVPRALTTGLAGGEAHLWPSMLCGLGLGEL